MLPILFNLLSEDLSIIASKKSVCRMQQPRPQGLFGAQNGDAERSEDTGHEVVVCGVVL